MNTELQAKQAQAMGGKATSQVKGRKITRQIPVRFRGYNDSIPRLLLSLTTLSLKPPFLQGLVVVM